MYKLFRIPTKKDTINWIEDLENSSFVINKVVVNLKNYFLLQFLRYYLAQLRLHKPLKLPRRQTCSRL